MTISELYKQVAGLGFESSLEDEDIFLNAANRALLQVARIRPATRLCRVNHKPPKNLLNTSHSPTERSETLIYEANGAKAYYFEADGNGTAYVEFLDGGAWKIADIVHLSTEGFAFKPYKGFVKDGNDFVKGSVRIRFEGNFTYSVKSVALYASVYSDEAEDIVAFEPFTKYDISNMAKDFLSLAAPPVVEDEKRTVLSGGYDFEDGRILLLPHSKSGVYNVRYHHRPDVIFDDEDLASNSEKRIDLDDDLCHVLPNLVAAYILAEDEPQLAEYYLTLYNQQAAEIRAAALSYSSVPIILNGW